MSFANRLKSIAKRTTIFYRNVIKKMAKYLEKGWKTTKNLQFGINMNNNSDQEKRKRVSCMIVDVGGIATSNFFNATHLPTLMLCKLFYFTECVLSKITRY